MNSAHHLAISDINNWNVVVEWINGRMRVTETDIVTNHCLAENLESPMTGESYKRFAKLAQVHSDFKSQEDGLQTLKEASYEEEARCAVDTTRKHSHQPYTLTVNGANYYHSVSVNYSDSI